MVVAPYDSKFFSAQASGSLRSAREVISVVREMIEPRSVVDVGCGVGTWLKVWQDLGVEKTPRNRWRLCSGRSASDSSRPIQAHEPVYPNQVGDSIRSC